MFNFYLKLFSDTFDLGYDIQQYYSIHQNLTLEDLAKTNSRHTVNGLMRVISKVSNVIVNMSLILPLFMYIYIYIYICHGRLKLEPAKTIVVAMLLRWTGPLACLCLSSVGLVGKVFYL